MNTRANKRKLSIKINDYVSPSNLINHILQDPIIDYLDYYKINNVTDVPDIERLSLIKKNEFDEFIKLKGIEFEDKVINYFSHEIYKINGSCSQENFDETLKALDQRRPIIYQGVLFDSKNKTYGRPDLIIRGDYLNKMFNQNENSSLYYIIDIKFLTVKLSSDRSYILNAGLVQFYKVQILVYTNALNEILNQNVKKGFILGKKYISESKNIKTIIYNDKFDKLALIDYTKDDAIKSYVKAKLAVDWILKLRNEGHMWNLLPKPIIKELYPNMSNNYDSKWRLLKKDIAEKIKDLTLIVNVGPKQRNIAFHNNIFSYNDIKCNSSMLGLNGKNGIIVDNIIKINADNCLNIFRPNKIKYNKSSWRKNIKMEFFLDYETTNDFENKNYIFMIGVGYIKNKAWNFKYFFAINDKLKSQKDMFTTFLNYINQVLIKEKNKEPIFIHWTAAEPTFYNKIKNELKLPEAYFLDLYKVFVEEPIVIKGALNYSLKTIAKTMYKHKMIKTSWIESSCNNGLDAMLLAYKLYSTNKNVVKNDLLDIIKYNEIDCKVLYEIIEYIRKYH
jgi:hypothetical protein